jgi:hypothetical protein
VEQDQEDLDDTESVSAFASALLRRLLEARPTATDTVTDFVLERAPSPVWRTLVAALMGLCGDGDFTARGCNWRSF